MSSQARSSGVKNDNIPLRIIAFARIRRLNGECCLGDVFEHPGPPNRWRRGPQAHPEEAKRAPRDTEEQPRAPEMKPREPPRPPKKKPREPSRAPRQFLSKRPEITEVKIVLPPRRGHDFRCQRSGDRRTFFHLILDALAGPLEIPWVLRCAQKTSTMMNSTCLETIYCCSSLLISVKILRAGRFTPCEPSSGRF